MISVQVDEKEVRKIYLEKVEEKVRTVDAELVFWDTNELKRRTCMSWNTIQKEFSLIQGSQNLKLVQNGTFHLKKLKSFCCNGYLKDKEVI